MGAAAVIRAAEDADKRLSGRAAPSFTVIYISALFDSAQRLVDSRYLFILGPAGAVLMHEEAAARLTELFKWLTET